MRRILIIHDELPPTARPDELDTLAQAREVADALTAIGMSADTLAVGLDLGPLHRRLAGRDRPDAVFNLVESAGGTGGLIHLAPSVSEAAGVPLVGCPADAIRRTNNKLISKRELRDAGMPTPDWCDSDNLTALDPGLGWIIKSVSEHASIGLDADSIVPAHAPRGTAESLLSRQRDSIGGAWFAEEYIDGREFNIALLDRGDGTAEVLPHAEIDFASFAVGAARVVGYRAKWDETSFEYHNTPRRFDFDAGDAALLDRLSAIALECWSLFGLRGWARVDFRVDDAGRPWVLEVNANPCLSPDAGFLAAAGRAGRSLDNIILRLLAAAGCAP